MKLKVKEGEKMLCFIDERDGLKRKSTCNKNTDESTKAYYHCQYNLVIIFSHWTFFALAYVF